MLAHEKLVEKPEISDFPSWLDKSQIEAEGGNSTAACIMVQPVMTAVTMLNILEDYPNNEKTASIVMGMMTVEKPWEHHIEFLEVAKKILKSYSVDRKVAEKCMYKRYIDPVFKELGWDE